MASPRSRIALAIALTVAFYGLAIGVGVGLIAAPILGYVLLDHGNIWLTIALIGAGVGVLRELVRRREGFVAPGPELTADAQPRLHALLAETAKAAGDHAADVVYLDLEANAGVTEDARRRILVLGLPLLAALDEDELRAVVAHEHGHYVGGDTQFTRWIWRTRVTAIATMVALRDSDRWFRANVAYWPFRGYAALFLRVTNAVSRRQEFAADALAARVTSPEVSGRALRRVNGVAAAWEGFWAGDAAPMLEAGRRPPLVTGFTAMLAHADVVSALEGISAAEVISGDPDPYASHPTLGQRLEAVGAPVDGGMPAPAPRPAVGLLEGVDALERQLLRDRFGAQVDELEAGDWDAAGLVHLEGMRATAEVFGDVWPRTVVADAGRIASELDKVRGAVRNRLEVDGHVPDDVLDEYALNGLACLVTVAAADAGHDVSAPPGAPVTVRHGGAELAPIRLLAKIRAGEEPAERWAADPVVAAVADRPLGTTPAVPGAAAPG